MQKERLERLQASKQINPNIGYIKGQKTAGLRVKKYLEKEQLSKNRVNEDSDEEVEDGTAFDMLAGVGGADSDSESTDSDGMLV